VPAQSKTHASVAQDQRGEQADRAGAQHQRRLVEGDSGQIDRADRHRQRLDQRPRPVVDRVGQREQHAFIDHHLTGVGARPAGAEADAVAHRVQAHLFVAGPAERALAALPERKYAHPVARSPPLNAVADGDDPA
jgi:hypothetical protein